VRSHGDLGSSEPVLERVLFFALVGRGERIHREFQWAVAGRVSEVEWFSSLHDARQKSAKFREHYNHERPHSALADRSQRRSRSNTGASRKKVSTSMGRALKSPLIESLEYAKPASNEVNRTVRAQNL
jgi:Integrase core domain